MLLCMEGLTLFIQIAWGNGTSGRSLCTDYQHDGDGTEEEDLLNGGCYIDNHISSLWAMGLAACFLGALANYNDLSAAGKESIDLARNKIRSLFDADPFEKGDIQKGAYLYSNPCASSLCI